MPRKGRPRLRVGAGLALVLALNLTFGNFHKVLRGFSLPVRMFQLIFG